MKGTRRRLRRLEWRSINVLRKLLPELGSLPPPAETHHQLRGTRNQKQR
jgi:hypothetical protein